MRALVPHNPTLSSVFVDPAWYKLQNVALGTCFLYQIFSGLLVFCLEYHNGKRMQIALALYVSTISAMTHWSDHHDYNPLFLSVEGQRVNGLRYLMWTFTTPAMLFMIQIT